MDGCFLGSTLKTSHSLNTHILSLLTLQQIKGLGPKRLSQLLEHFGSIEQLMQANSTDFSELNNSAFLKHVANTLADIQDQQLNHPFVRQALQDIEQCEAENISIISSECSQYPTQLKHCISHPALLYVKGDIQALQNPQIAIVGARNASQDALETAYHWAHILTDSGLTVTSGLAEGIDGAAHQGALASTGQTIAVLAHGLDHIYPRRHQPLFDQAIEQGCVVSEFALGIKPQREFFPRRNRIISGLSLGVCVIEAAIKSGSLITARYAIEQNREVFALPNHINNPMAEGCHYLIQQGAFLVTEPQQILEHLGIETSKLPIKNQEHHNKDAIDTSLLSHIPFNAIHFDKLSEQSHLPTATIASQLMQLELQGLIRSDASGYRRVK